MPYQIKTYYHCRTCGFIFGSPYTGHESCPCGAGHMKIISLKRYVSLSKQQDKLWVIRAKKLVADVVENSSQQLTSPSVQRA